MDAVTMQMKFRNLKEGSKVKVGSQPLTSEKHTFFEESHGIQSPGEKGVQKSWLIFIHHFQAQEWSVHTCRKSNKGYRRLAWMNKELLTKLKHKKEACKR